MLVCSFDRCDEYDIVLQMKWQSIRFLSGMSRVDVNNSLFSDVLTEVPISFTEHEGREGPDRILLGMRVAYSAIRIWRFFPQHNITKFTMRRAEKRTLKLMHTKLRKLDRTTPNTTHHSNQLLDRIFHSTQRQLTRFDTLVQRRQQKKRKLKQAEKRKKKKMRNKE
jgi:hypothetical protein